MSDVTRTVRASEHPDPDVREAENFAIALKSMLDDMNGGKISAEILGHSYQKFCVDQIKRIKQQEGATKDAEIEQSRIAAEFWEKDAKAGEFWENDAKAGHDMISKMTQEIARLNAKLETARAALKFYADTANGPWGGDSRVTTINQMDVEVIATGPTLIPYGGRRAREALAAIGGES